MKKLSLVTLSLLFASAAFADQQPLLVANCDKCDLLCYSYETNIRYRNGKMARKLQAELYYNLGGNTGLGTVYLTTAAPGDKPPKFYVCIGQKDAAGMLVIQLHTVNSSPGYYERFELPFKDRAVSINRILPFDP